MQHSGGHKIGGSNTGLTQNHHISFCHQSCHKYAAEVESDVLYTWLPLVPLSDMHTDAAISLKWRRYLVWTAMVGRKRKILPGAREPRVRTWARIWLV